MTDTQFKATLQLLVPLVIRRVMELLNVSEREAFETLYCSKLYRMLEEEETKMWHLSPLCLAQILQEELETGEVNFPHEA